MKRELPPAGFIRLDLVRQRVAFLPIAAFGLLRGVVVDSGRKQREEQEEESDGGKGRSTDCVVFVPLVYLSIRQPTPLHWAAYEGPLVSRPRRMVVHWACFEEALRCRVDPLSPTTKASSSFTSSTGEAHGAGEPLRIISSALPCGVDAIQEGHEPPSCFHCSPLLASRRLPRNVLFILLMNNSYDK